MYSVSKEQEATAVIQELRKEHNRHQLQLFKMFGAIFVANIITWLPIAALAIGALAIDFAKVSSAAITFVYTTYISHSVIHPILESWFISELREATKTVLCFCCRKRSRDRVQGTLQVTGSRDINGENSKENKTFSTNTHKQANMVDSSGSVGSSQCCQCWGEAGSQGGSRAVGTENATGMAYTEENRGQKKGQEGVVSTVDNEQ